MSQCVLCNTCKAAVLKLIIELGGFVPTVDHGHRASTPTSSTLGISSSSSLSELPHSPPLLASTASSSQSDSSPATSSGLVKSLPNTEATTPGDATIEPQICQSADDDNITDNSVTDTDVSQDSIDPMEVNNQQYYLEKYLKRQ